MTELKKIMIINQFKAIFEKKDVKNNVPTPLTSQFKG
jgi:hypothetical protein